MAGILGFLLPMCEMQTEFLIFTFIPAQPLALEFVECPLSQVN